MQPLQPLQHAALASHNGLGHAMAILPQLFPSLQIRYSMYIIQLLTSFHGGVRFIMVILIIHTCPLFYSLQFRQRLTQPQDP